MPIAYIMSNLIVKYRLIYYCVWIVCEVVIELYRVPAPAFCAGRKGSAIHSSSQIFPNFDAFVLVKNT